MDWLQLLKDNWILVAAAAIFFLQGDKGSKIMEYLIKFIRGTTNSPDPTGNMENSVGRVCAAKCLANEYEKRGESEVATKIRSTLQVLIDAK